MATYTFKTLTLLRERPANIAADAVIFNAPRPLFGMAWQGDFCAGDQYAAVSPTAPDRGVLYQMNLDLDATVLLYIDEATARQMVKDYIVNEYGGATLEELTSDLFEDYWRDAFYQNCGRGEIALEV